VTAHNHRRPVIVRRSVTEALMTALFEHDVIDRRIARIGHSLFSAPEFVLAGIGPARFRSHFVLLDSGIVID
jgi:hypothetical protein